MDKLKFFTVILMVLTTMIVHAQSDRKSRGLLQQEFIDKHFITPHLEEQGPLKITSTKDIDSLFTVINAQWKKIAPDTLSKYKINLALEDFEHIDSYVYLWTLVSITQNLNLPLKYREHLVRIYMIPAMRNDFLTIQRKPDLTAIQLVHSGTLKNTLSLGSDNGMKKETVLLSYQLYSSFKDLFESLTNNTDTAISNYSKNQLMGIRRFTYDLNAKFNYYNGKEDESLSYVLKGLMTNEYPRSRIFAMSNMLLNKFISTKNHDRSMELLDALTMNTTSDNMDRDTLLNWYLRADPINGKNAFKSTINKVPVSSFKKTGETIMLPKNWNFIFNSIAPEKIKKVKYYLVDMWYTSCGPCILEIPELNTFFKKLEKRDDVQFISINTDFFNGNLDEKYVSDRSKELNIRFPVIYDDKKSDITNKLSVHKFPSKFIIDYTGQLIAKIDSSPMTLKTFELFMGELVANPKKDFIKDVK